MSGVKVQISVDTSDARAALRRIKKRMGDYRPVFKLAKDYLEQANAENFATRGLRSGQKWAAYGNWTPEVGQTAKLVGKTGNLMDSLVNLNGAANDMGRKSAKFGTDIKYAEFHQYGTRNMPARTIVFEPFEFSKTMARWVDNYIDEVI